MHVHRGQPTSERPRRSYNVDNLIVLHPHAFGSLHEEPRAAPATPRRVGVLRGELALLLDQDLSRLLLRGETDGVALSRQPSAESRYLCMRAWKSRFGDRPERYGPKMDE